MHLNGEIYLNVIKWGGGILLGVCKWTEKIYGYEKNCPQGVVCPCPGAIYMYMTMIFKHLL